MLDDLFRADTLAIGQELVILPVIKRDQNLRRSDAARNRAEDLRAFGMLLDVRQRSRSGKQVETDIGLGGVLAPAGSPVPQLEVC